MPYKLVGLKLMTVPTSARFVLPDLRLVLGTVLLIIFLAVGWLRTASRQPASNVKTAEKPAVTASH